MNAFREATTMRGSGPHGLTCDVLSQSREEQAVGLLFRNGFDSVEIAALLRRTEPEIVSLIHGERLLREPG